MAYTIEIHPDARDDLSALPTKKLRRQVDRKIRSLAKTPRPPKATPLKGKRFKGLWKARSGDYRIIYQINDDVLVVLIVRIRDRRDVYRSR